MHAGAVIALQEVEAPWWKGSADWLRMPGGLAEVFNGNGYAWKWQAGGGANVFMGVMLAWPKARFEGDVHYTDLAAMVPQGGDASFELARKKTRNGKERPLHNNVLVGNLWEKGTGQRMTVATCHMPVLWKTVEERRAQTILLNIAVGALQHKARSAPAVLLGDFNFKPDSAQYALAARGYAHALEHHSATLEPLQVLAGAFGRPQRMRSAYRECFGDEPAFTNHAQVKLNDPFIGTLDYIWMSIGVAAEDCLLLPKNSKGPLPDKEEGSDHVPVVAMLVIGVPQKEGATSLAGLEDGMATSGDSDIARRFEELVWRWEFETTLKYKRQLAKKTGVDEFVPSLSTGSSEGTSPKDILPQENAMPSKQVPFTARVAEKTSFEDKVPQQSAGRSKGTDLKAGVAGKKTISEENVMLQFAKLDKCTFSKNHAAGKETRNVPKQSVILSKGTLFMARLARKQTTSEEYAHQQTAMLSKGTLFKERAGRNTSSFEE
uniref:Endonuclease/exonuclease/phosphatase domain-containing protein n=1 Tax=Zooxanthella nutricula TaxID=1333877 RepID=A0A7S2L4U7_9DINO